MQIEEAIDIVKEIKRPSLAYGFEKQSQTLKAIGIVLNELEKKDKVIDKMAKMINNHDIDEDVCKQMGKNKDCNDYIMFEENCIKCIKEYFYKKVR